MNIKVNLPKKDCSGISLIPHNTNVEEEIYDYTKFRAFGEYSLQLRVQVVKDGRRYQKKKTRKFSQHTTLNQAVDKMIALRVQVYNDLKDGTIQEIRAHKISPRTVETLDIIFKAYINQKKEILASKTISSYESFYTIWLKDKLGSFYITDINKGMLQSIVNKILSQRAPRTAKTLKEILNPIFKTYFHAGVITSNPVELLEFKKYDNVVNPDLSDEKIKILYQCIYSYKLEPYRGIFIWLATGRRVNEVLSLKWEDVNLNTRTYIVKAESNKAKKNMTYALDDDLMDILTRKTQRVGYIFPSMKNKKKKMHNDTIGRHWKNILENAKIDNLRIHDLRHIMGLKLVNAGVSLEVIASVLGHTTTSITKRYSKVRTETASNALSQFKELIK